jgi:hypothetical protein
MSRDAELARLVREGFLARRRAAPRAVLERGIQRGDLRGDLDLELDVVGRPTSRVRESSPASRAR